MEDFFDIFTFNFFLIFMICGILFYMLFWMPVTRTIIRDTFTDKINVEGILDGSY